MRLRTTVYFLEDVTDFSRLLNPSGQAAARRLLWALFAFFRGGLEFCPVSLLHLHALLGCWFAMYVVLLQRWMHTTELLRFHVSLFLFQ